MKPPDLSVVQTIYARNARQVPEMLRSLALDIEEGRVEADAVVCVVELDLGPVQVYGWGETNLVHTIGLLQMGQFQLARMRNPEGHPEFPVAT